MLIARRRTALPLGMWGRACSVGFQRLAKEGNGLGDCRAGGVGLAAWVEHHEVVMDAVVPDGCDRDPGAPELCGVGLALVARDVGLVDEQQCRRQSAELFDRGPVR